MTEGKRKIRVGRGAAGGLGRGGVWLRSMRGRATRQIMKPHRSPPCPPPAIADRIPVFVLTWMQPFRACFTAPVWQHVLVLVMGAVLAPGKRTVTAALRVMGLDAISNFTSYHQVLNRARWRSRALARCLLELIVTTLLGDGPVLIGFDDTVERRWVQIPTHPAMHSNSIPATRTDLDPAIPSTLKAARVTAS